MACFLLASFVQEIYMLEANSSIQIEQKKQSDQYRLEVNVSTPALYK